MDGSQKRSLAELAGARVLVLGDVMLDRYLHGSMGRISPEAPVPIVTLAHESCHLGGAGHVAASIASLGGTVTLAGLVGDDADGQRLRMLAEEAGIVRRELRSVPGLETISKTRVVAGKYQQILRIDRDGRASTLAAEAAASQRQLVALVSEHDVVVLADYNKGNLPDRLVAAVIQACREQGIPCLADPKKDTFEAYVGATLLTPNVYEAARASGTQLEGYDAVSDAARRLREQLQLEYMVITCGAEGMIAAGADGVTHIPAEVREVADVTGAGDTVVSVLALCLARGWPIDEACHLASLAAGIAVSKPRTYVVKSDELAQAWRGESVKIVDAATAARRVAEARRLGHVVVFTNGCFDLLHAGHLSCLERARKLGDLLVLGLNSDRSVRANKGPGRPALGEEHRAALLAGLACVDMVIVFDEDTPEELIRRLAPDVLVKGDRPGEPVVGAEFVAARGGRIVVLPLVEGLSTSSFLKLGRWQSAEAGAPRD